MTRPHIQSEIPGTEPPPDPVCTPDLDAQVHGWLDALDSQKRAAADTKTRHLVLLAKLAEAGVTKYPYVDRATGKKHYVVVARDPKAKTIKAPKPKAAEKKQRDKAESVEHRKVSRASVEGELRHAVPAAPDDADPFQKVRNAMDGLA